MFRLYLYFIWSKTLCVCRERCLIPGLSALASPGAAHRGVGRGAGGGGESLGGPSFLDDVGDMCMSAGTFFTTVGGPYEQSLDMYDFTLVCAVTLQGHDSLVVVRLRLVAQSA